ncbi:hypothetical protein KJ765_06675 [Candidatus Micrarchaeota archaeon]|nr:hypothetical protein [Candidatus Micrarchaeota archaeon]
MAMLDLQKMRKVRVITLKDRVESVIGSLYDFGDIDVRDCQVSDLDRPLSSFEPISEMLIKLRAMEHQLHIKPEAPEAPIYSLEEAKKQYGKLRLHDAERIQKDIQELQAKKEHLVERKEDLLPFRKLYVDSTHLEGASVQFVYFELKPGTEKKLKAELKTIPHELLYVNDDGKRYALLAFDVRMETDVNVLVLKYGVIVHAIPDVQEGFGEALSKVEGELAVTESQLQNAKERLKTYREQYGPKLQEVKAGLKVLAVKAELPFKFGKTAHFSVVEGWITDNDVLDFEKRLARIPNVFYEYPETNDLPPSKLSNAKLVRPYEFLVEFFSLPKSYSLDPTLFIFLTFPLFFGMILGDIGYGLISFFLALFLKLKSKNALVKRIAGMLALAAFSTIVFGFIYGEAFGREDLFGIELHPLLHRLEHPETLINLSILVGAIHVAMGFLLGFFTQFKERHMKHAIAKLSWLVVELSLIAIVIQNADISLLEFLVPLKFWMPYPYSVGLLVLGLGGIAKLESPTHLLELPGLISNVLSYLRIAALGISGVVLAIIINQVPVDFAGTWAMLTLQKPFDIGAFLGFVAFLLIFVFGQIGAMTLGLFESSIQTLRLHYVEFFSKFYEGGGVAFKPLREKGEP